MTGKIVLEEHFALPDTIDNSERYFTPDIWPKMKHRLVDIHETRLAEMDKHGIGVMKRDLFPSVKDPVALDLMRSLKHMLAPNGILNPGKVL